MDVAVSIQARRSCLEILRSLHFLQSSVLSQLGALQEYQFQEVRGRPTQAILCQSCLDSDTDTVLSDDSRCGHEPRNEVMGHDYNLPFGPWGMEAEPTSTLGAELQPWLSLQAESEVGCSSRTASESEPRDVLHLPAPLQFRGALFGGRLEHNCDMTMLSSC